LVNPSLKQTLQTQQGNIFNYGDGVEQLDYTYEEIEEWKKKVFGDKYLLGLFR
jgi:phage pi2 protein 07